MLNLLPCLDSSEMSGSRQRELNIPRNIAAELGRSAVEAAKTGSYLNRQGAKVDWGREVRAACSAKVSIAPDADLPSHEDVRFSETRIQVTNETTLGASRRFVECGLHPLALNFANGVNPGGGFLGGARAQEEVLCRSSALFATLAGDPMYDEHARRAQPDSTEWAIYSPDVPVFRLDDGTELAQPWPLSFLTCAAPYAPSVGQPRAGDLLQKRIHRVLAIARAYGHRTVVLGAWGCGAFLNDPKRTALDFRGALEAEFSGAFSEVVFAIADWSPDRRFLGPFRDVFAREDPHELSRFVRAQEEDYDRAFSEITSGRKRTHWMWYIFPQIDGLAFSSTSKRYSIKSVDEARAYLDHPVLGPRLLECARAVVRIDDRSAGDIFGSPDDLKLRSCATLFAHVLPAGSVFDRLLSKYYRGRRDTKTLQLLSPEAES